MAAASVILSGSSIEVLAGDNFERWSVLMRNYLISEGLWKIVNGDQIEEESEDPETWERKNAKALYAIQLSCGPDFFKQISKISLARDAWSRLSNLLLSPESKANPVDPGTEDRLLHQLVRSGNWHFAKALIQNKREDPSLTDSSGKTVLHIAVIAGRENIVEELASIEHGQLLTMQDNNGYTALALVAQVNGNTRMAECMVEKNPDLLTMKTKDDQIPLLLASASGHKDLTRYLYFKTGSGVLTHNDRQNGTVLLSNCITAQIFDVALKLLQIEMNYHPVPPLLALANMPSVFPSGCRLHWWQRAIYATLILRPHYEGPCRRIRVKIVSQKELDDWLPTPQRGPELSLGMKIWQVISVSLGEHWAAVSNSQAVKLLGEWLRGFRMGIQDSILLKIPVIKKVYDIKLTHYMICSIMRCLIGEVISSDETQLGEASVHEALLQAVKYGTVEFIESLSQRIPTLLLATDKNKRDVLSHVVLNRQEKLKYLLTRAVNPIKMTIGDQDVLGNNMLHQTAELGPSSDLDSRFGAALQMQREIQWFKDMEKIVHPMCKEARNAEGKKPHEVFTESHMELVKAGEKWAKDTAQSFTIVCTLIITITFAAAFTVPGGNNQETGIPIFLNRTLFEVFIMADAVSLVTSSSSVLLSIVILTSRQTEQDFLTRLPFMLMLNLLFLFMSLVAMNVAFCAGIAMMLKGYRNLVLAAISLASLPIIVFVRTQFHLFFKIALSTIRLDWFTSIFFLSYNVFILILIPLYIMSVYLIKMIKGCGNFCFQLWRGKVFGS